MAEFLAMGGYAQYVWSAYAIVLVILVGNIVKPWCDYKKLLKRKKQ